MVAKVRRRKDGTRFLDVEGEDWRDEYVTLFVDNGCEGVLIGAPDGPPVRDVGFLADLPGLRGVGCMKGVLDCSAVARLPGLTSLSLASDYAGPLSLRTLTRLTDLEMPYLPAVADLGALRELRELFIWFWPKTETSFEVLGDKPMLEFLRVEFKRTARVSTAGLARAPALARLWLYDGRLTDTEDLAVLTRLEELALRSTKLDKLDFVPRLPQLRTLELDNCGEIDSLAPIRGHPGLEQVTIAGRTSIADG